MIDTNQLKDKIFDDIEFSKLMSESDKPDEHTHSLTSKHLQPCTDALWEAYHAYLESVDVHEDVDADADKRNS